MIMHAMWLGLFEAAILYFAVFISPAFSQDKQKSFDCGKYCYTSCRLFRANDDIYNLCMETKAHCKCVATKFSLNNPLVIIFLIFSILVVLLIIGACYNLTCNMPPPACMDGQPITNIISTIPLNQATGHQRNSSPVTSNWGSGIVNVIVIPSAPEQIEDNPPEYLSPPPYNECVVGGHI